MGEKSSGRDYKDDPPPNGRTLTRAESRSTETMAALLYISCQGLQDAAYAVSDSPQHDIAGPDLNYARSTSLRRREDGAEIEIAGKDDGAVLRRPGQDLGVCGIQSADLRPVLCLMAGSPQSICPGRGKVDVDYKSHEAARSTSRSSARHAA